MRTRIILGIALLLAAAVLLVAPFVGLRLIPLEVALGQSEDDVARKIFWELRVPRVLVTFLAGIGLSTSGMALQAMFRNPLATPYTLGISGGAAFGAATSMLLGIGTLAPLAWLSAAGLSAESLFAFVGALLSILLVYGLTQLSRTGSTATMLLAGVAVSFFFAALIMFMQYLSDVSQSFRMVRWLMGGLETVGFVTVWNLLPFVIAGTAITFYLQHELNLLLTGEEIAGARGVDVRHTRGVIFFASSLMVGGVVAVCGPIGFVGMIIPHICRLLVGPDHRTLIPLVVLVGGAFLAVCDTLARTVIAPAELPVGIITSLLGGPFFIWLLVRGSAERGLFG